jgi:hypothetical protein
LGPELVVDGGTWFSEAGWSFLNGVATAAAASSSVFRFSTAPASLAACLVTFRITNYSSGTVRPALLGRSGNNLSGNGTFSFIATNVNGDRYLYFTGSNFTGTIDNISVRELPGNHAFQATSASRPVLSKRVNLLTKTEDFSDAAWGRSGIASVGTAGPDGLCLLTENTATAEHITSQTVSLVSGTTYKLQVRVKAAGRNTFSIYGAGGLSVGASIQATLAGNGTIAGGTNATIENLGSGVYLITSDATSTFTGSNAVYFRIGLGSYAGDGVSGVFIGKPDLRAANDGVNLPPYQRVNTATDYDGTGFPAYLRCDGVDDWMQTNSIDFGAGPANPPLGPELVTNGGFDSDTAWTKGAGWSITGGAASINGATGNSDLFQGISVVDGRFYVVEFDVSAISSNGRLYLLDPFFVTSPITTAGRKRLVVSSDPGRPNNVGIRALSSDASPMTATIDNISVRELTDTAYAPDKMTVVAGVRKLSDAASGILVELSPNSNSNNGTFYVAAPEDTARRYSGLSHGTVIPGAGQLGTTTSSAYSSPTTDVLAFTGDISGDSNVLRIDSSLVGTGTADQGTGNYGNYPLYLFRRGGTALPFNGRFYGAVIRGAQSSASQIDAAERYMNSLTKAF